MDFDSYEMQILIALARACKPNSPYPERAWARAQPISGLPEFGNALARLLRDGFIERKKGYKVRPSSKGYELLLQWKTHMQALKQRPAMFDRVRDCADDLERAA